MYKFLLVECLHILCAEMYVSQFHAAAFYEEAESIEKFI